jgi:hypothetical protein
VSRGTFFWRGGSALDLAADWTEPAIGPGPAPVAPGTADSATIDGVAALDATGTLAVATLGVGTELGLAGSAAIAVGGAMLLPGTIAIGVSGTLAGTGRIDAPVALAGQIVAQGGALALFAPVTGSGTLSVAAGATLFAADPVGAGLTASFQGTGGTLELFTAAASFAAGITGFATGDVIDIADAAITSAVWNSGTLTLTDAGGATIGLALAGSFPGASFVALPDGTGGSAVRLATPIALPSGATLALNGVYDGSGSAGAVQASGTVALAGSLQAGSLAASGLLAVLPGATLAAGTLSLAGRLVAEGAVVLGGAAAAAGTVVVGSGATLAGNGRIDTALACDGVLAAAGGTLALFGAASGSGTLAIGAGATLFAAGAVAPGLAVAFGADATLDLAVPAAFAGTLIGLAPGDAIDLGFTSGLVGLPLAAQLAGQSFATAPDGAGGTLVSIVPCFAAGTRIATPAGAVPVEQLRPGDAVLTPEGPRRLCWVGRRDCDAAAAPELRPVRLAAGCLGPATPARDLYLSPEHAVLLGGVLVRAVALLDRPGVVRAQAGRIAYHHLGLAPHGLVLAEGAWAETWLPDGPARFDAEAGTRPPPGPSCLPRVAALPPPHLPPLPRPGRLLGHLERIAADGPRLRLEGWALDEAAPLRPVELEMVRRGVVLTRIHANLWRPDLDRARLGDGRCGFIATVANAAGGLLLYRCDDKTVLPNTGTILTDS